MKYIKVLLLLSFAIPISCSVQRIHNKFDNSTCVRLELTRPDFVRLSGEIKIDRIIFTKEFKNGKVSETKLFCKFKRYYDEHVEGGEIELNIDGIIHKVPLNNANYLEIEATLSKDIQDALLKSRSLLLRVYTKNTDGITVSQNVFQDKKYEIGSAIDEIKKFIKTMPEP